MEICTCFKCWQHTITNSEGHTRQGLLVHRTTRARHWLDCSKQEDDTINQMLPKISSKPISLASIPSDGKFQNNISDLEDNSVSLPDRKTEFEIICLIMRFIMWLYLFCGLSKINCQKARDDLVHIIELVSQRLGLDC
ncbi:hypothetical protein O181_026153, partial [Austropuccinia psidii MF-1]|nr:hypothetical protein [Austropuccinia psidii MF-1]